MSSRSADPEGELGALDFSVNDLAQTACRAYHYAQGILYPPWDKLSLKEQDAWEKAVLKGQHLIENADQIRWVEIARRLQNAHESIVCLETPHAYDKLSIKEQFAWEAVARHLANLIGADEIPDLAALETHWGPWVIERLTKLEQPA